MSRPLRRVVVEGGSVTMAEPVLVDVRFDGGPWVKAEHVSTLTRPGRSATFRLLWRRGVLDPPDGVRILARIDIRPRENDSVTWSGGEIVDGEGSHLAVRLDVLFPIEARS